LFLQAFFGPNNHAGEESSHEHLTPHASHVPLLSIEQSGKHSMAYPGVDVTGAPSSGRPTPDPAEHGHGLDEEPDIDIGQVAFPRSTHVAITRTLETTFLVDENLVPINIEKILGV
jgi:hypothetical protein